MKPIVSEADVAKVVGQLDELIAFADEIADHVLAATLDSARDRFNKHYSAKSDGLADR